MKHSGACATFIVFCFFASDAAFAQTPEFYSDAPTASVNISVKASGTYVGDLNQDDFELLEDGHVTDLDSCDFAQLPLDLLFITDTFSLDYARNGNNIIKGTVEGFQAMPENERIAAIQLYKGSVHKFVDWTLDHWAVHWDSNRKPPAKGRVRNDERLLDALSMASTMFQIGEEKRRRAVLVLSDDCERGSESTLDDVTRKLQERSISVIEIKTEFYADPKKHSQIAMVFPKTIPLGVPKKPVGASIAPLCKATGGEQIGWQDIPHFFADVLERIRSRSTLAFRPRPGDTPGFRDISVRLKPEAAARYPNAELIYQARYFYTPDTKKH